MAAFTTAHLATAGFDQQEHDPVKKPGRGIITVRSVRINFDALATATGTALTNTDTYQCLHLRDGEIVLAAGINVITAATAAADCDLGFTTDDSVAFVEAQIMNTAGVDRTQDTDSGHPPVYIDSADTLDLVTATQTLAGCEAVIWAVIIRLEGVTS